LFSSSNGSIFDYGSMNFALLIIFNHTVVSHFILQNTGMFWSDYSTG